MSLKLIWLLDLASNFRIPILLVSVILWSGVIIFPGYALTFITLGIAFITTVFAVFPLSSWIDRVPHRSGEELEITTFNIQWDIYNHNKCVDHIRKLSSNIVILQEVTDTTRKEINALIGNFPYQFGDGHSHTMVISRLPLEDFVYLDWPGKFSNRAIGFSIDHHGTRLHFIGLHLQVTRNSDEIRLREQQIASLIAHCNKLSTQPIIVCGDFNAAIGSRVLNRICQECSLVPANSLLNYKPTWPTRLGCMGVQIDHFLVGDKMSVGSTSLGPMTESDHRPLSINLHLE